jgi:hypothetical protein
MCNHRFVYPEDKIENRNPDGMSLTGRCKCGAIQDSYGMRWAINRSDYLKKDDPCYLNQIDNLLEVW